MLFLCADTIRKLSLLIWHFLWGYLATYRTCLNLPYWIIKLMQHKSYIYSITNLTTCRLINAYFSVANTFENAIIRKLGINDKINLTIYQFKYRTRWIKPDWDCGVMSNENRFILIYFPYAMTHTQWVGHTLIGDYTFWIIPNSHYTIDMYLNNATGHLTVMLPSVL